MFVLVPVFLGSKVEFLPLFFSFFQFLLVACGFLEAFACFCSFISSWGGTYLLIPGFLDSGGVCCGCSVVVGGDPLVFSLALEALLLAGHLPSFITLTQNGILAPSFYDPRMSK
jgi:hypothetical protein